MNTTQATIEAIQVMQYAVTANDAADVASALMAQDGFLGGRIYPAIGHNYSAEVGRLVFTREGWNVQMFFRLGSASGRKVILIESMQRQCGMI